LSTLFLFYLEVGTREPPSKKLKIYLKYIRKFEKTAGFSWKNNSSNDVMTDLENSEPR
jgi:hypothetical protein